ncbi:unnamed protein product [Lymnaea stagnalis]|uniref:TIR domain-containing protein n=1 Tax=Lymnaea stagnalis TaxID=6523 RepID=A0AAV2HP80_LYMST
MLCALSFHSRLSTRATVIMVARLLVFTILVLLNGVSPKDLVPPSWMRMCKVNVSFPEPPTESRPRLNPYVASVNCHIKTDDDNRWRLMDLRNFTFANNINYHTDENNRTLHYKIQVTCENGANISLPKPMKVPGLLELEVRSCLLLDQFANYNDPLDPTIPNELRILDIRDSMWGIEAPNFIVNNLDEALNITSDYDCGQDTSLVVFISRNVSNVLPALPGYLDMESLLQKPNLSISKQPKAATSDLPSETVDEIAPTGPVKPETRLIKDAEKVVSDQITLGGDTSKAKPTGQSGVAVVTEQEQTTRKSNAEELFLDLLIKSFKTKTECHYNRLKVHDESIARLTPVNMFEFFVKNSDYPVLEVLNFSRIGMTDLPREFSQWRRFFPKLISLDLSHNNLSALPLTNYPPGDNEAIVHFNLTYNNFTTVNMALIQSWARMTKVFVDIDKNPIHCDCELASFIGNLRNASTFTGNLAPYAYVRHLECATPEPLSGRQLHTLSVDDLSCLEYESHQAELIALGVTLSVLVLAIVVIIRYKFEIRILLYTRLHVRLPCDADDLRHQKTYDAFVSYSNDDDAWVYENLVKFLENPGAAHTSALSSNGLAKTTESEPTKACKSHNTWHGDKSQFRLCIHQRDFVPGKTIFDNIVDSIEASRHTIIVLSPSFMRSHWAMEELRQAYRQSLVEKTRHLIVLLLQKVPKDEMDPLIARCCKTFTYLDVGDSLFKDRLVFSLTTKDKSARRRERVAAKEQRSKISLPHLDPSVATMEQRVPKSPSPSDSGIYDSITYAPYAVRPYEPVFGLSNTSTSSATVLVE